MIIQKIPAKYTKEVDDNPVSIYYDVNQFKLNRALRGHSDHSSLLWYDV